MDIDDALALLGLEPDARDDTIRRAYLRRIKKVRPDRDPEGFKALREAHDMLRDWVCWRDELSEPETGSAASSPADGPSGDTASSPTTAPPAPGETSPPVIDTAASDVVESPVAVEEAPDATHAAHVDASSPIADDAASSPAPDALDFDLDTLTPVPIGAPVESPWPALHRATQCVEVEDFAAAHRALEEAVEAAEQSYETAGTPTFCALVGQMIRSGAPPDTAALVARWMAVARTSGDLLHLPTDGAAVVLLLSELAAVWPDAPADTARTIAEAIAEADLDEAVPALQAYADAYPWGAIQFAEVLERRAPNLHAVYASTLELKDVGPSSPPPEGSSLPSWLWVIGFIVLLRVAASCDRESPSSRPIVEPRRLEQLAPPPPPPPVLLDMPPELSIPPPAPAPRGPRLIEDGLGEANREALREAEELLRELQRQTREDPTR